MSEGEAARIIRIECGVDHTLAMTQHGNLFAWGLGNYGNLGMGDTNDCFTPRLVPLQHERCRDIAAGAKHSMTLTTQGCIFSWGYGGNGRLGRSKHADHDGTDASLLPGKVTTKVGERALVVKT